MRDWATHHGRRGQSPGNTLPACREARCEQWAHVGLVDSHSEGDRRHHRVEPPLLKFLLHSFATSRIETGVIGRGWEFGGELLRQCLCLFAGRRIHDGGAPCFVLQQASDKGWSERRRHLHHFDAKVFAAEAINKSRCVCHSQLGDDVVLHARSGRGGERDDRCRTQCRHKLPEHTIVRTKVVPPLRDAVGLVNGDQRWFPFCEHLDETGHPQPLRGDE